MTSKTTKKVYLDYAAATPLSPEVRRAMQPYLTEDYGNPSSLHDLGRSAKEAVEESRVFVARALGCRPEEIVFTAGGTEANNLAILGVLSIKGKAHFITTNIEHPSVMETAEAFSASGGEVTYIPVESTGLVKPLKIIKAIKRSTLLISVMYANNEIGTIQPIQNLARELAKINKDRLKKGWKPVLLHTDACQAPSYLKMDVHALGVDLMTINGSKIYGPKQVGALFVSRKIKTILPVIHGGGQEAGLRSGTENVAGVVGLSKALTLAIKNRTRESARLIKLRDYLTSELVKISGIVVNGDLENRLPNNVNISVTGFDGETLIIYLDKQGIMASTGSACSSTKIEASHVIKALGLPRAHALSSIRFSLGRANTKQDMDVVVSALKKVLKVLGGG
ncbi:cysteine desulfurase NifS [bacterium]|nr:cysteine desulfurase NifS [bacterium]|tara:strand:- start:1052 stop:2233 length:1182 start_codon:yes stop_codon:yes gene_type:complete